MKRGLYDYSVKDFKGGTLEKIFDLAYRQCGIVFSIVFPKTDGWGHVELTDTGPNTDFCALIQSSKEGSKHCKMCHVLMTVAACCQNVSEQTCHAGATVLVNPVEEDGDEGMALLTSCAFRHEEKEKIWKFVKQRTKQLGLDQKEVRTAFDTLPDLNDERRHCINALMPLATVALRELVAKIEMEEELRDLRNLKGKATPGELLEKEFVHAVQGGGEFDHDINLPDLNQEKMPALIKVVCSLVSRRPQIPYTVEELATAARLTSNYFSSMFHKYTGQCFVDYLTDRRIDRAQTLLLDPSLNISEISSMCGYDDPGYFARRFRKKTGVTPRAWREKGDKAIPKNKEIA